jgi:hypothetical protein
VRETPFSVTSRADFRHLARKAVAFAGKASPCEAENVALGRQDRRFA